MIRFIKKHTNSIIIFDRITEINEVTENPVINLMKYIKSMKITITIAKNILSKFDTLGLKQKSITTKEDLKCLIFFKEHKSLISGGEFGNVYVFKINTLQQIKKFKINDSNYF